MFHESRCKPFRAGTATQENPLRSKEPRVLAVPSLPVASAYLPQGDLLPTPSTVSSLQAERRRKDQGQKVKITSLGLSPFKSFPRSHTSGPACQPWDKAVGHPFKKDRESWVFWFLFYCKPYQVEQIPGSESKMRRRMYRGSQQCLRCWAIKVPTSAKESIAYISTPTTNN